MDTLAGLQTRVIFYPPDPAFDTFGRGLAQPQLIQSFGYPSGAGVFGLDDADDQ